MSEAKILSVEELLGWELRIPPYQRPYKWTKKNITDLLLDIETSIREAKKYKDFKYRVGTVILHANTEEGKLTYDIVDGQQRILSFLLLSLYFYLECGIGSSLSKHKFSSKVTQKNLHENYKAIWEWFAFAPAGMQDFKQAIKKHLEVVVITVDEISEAFQLFDSQNSRGRALYPHDLLKAYHLREIHDKYDMQRAVLKWESKDPKAIRELFDNYLFPLWNWSKRRKSNRFTAAEIDLYKGIEESSGYTYARRANKAMPYFLLSEPLISGGDFFEMVDHYMQMLHSIKLELIDNPDFARIKDLLIDDKSKVGQIKTPVDLDKACKSSSTGMNHARNLFFCALLCYYDRFHNFDLMAVKKLFTWAMMLRVDMNHLGFDSVNRYAIGLGDNDKYTNSEPVISLISSARRHTEISGMPLIVKRDNDKAEAEKWQGLYEDLLLLNGYK